MIHVNSFANDLDERDPLKFLRKEFIFPKTSEGKDFLYFAGNSLGLQPKGVERYIQEELNKWATQAVEGHFTEPNPWVKYNETLTQSLAHLVGANPHEVVVMNTLTVNLHMLMATFYRPTKDRYKIIIEGGAFPSDQYAVDSQLRFHNIDPRDGLIELKPRSGEDTLRSEDILQTISETGSKLALVMMGNVNYLTGQAFPQKDITQAAHKVGAKVGFDLAHAAGNLDLSLHDDGPDFAVWCHYKYVNGGPGTIAGAFVHERHSQNQSLPRLAGWWGHNKATRFLMGPKFEPIPGAEGWQVSNPPVFQMAALRASFDIFDKTSMKNLKSKADQLTKFLEELLKGIPQIQVITPKDTNSRGTQLSLRVSTSGKDVLKKLKSHGAICDFREPNIIRVAPAPLYTRFQDLVEFSEILKICL
jgi:kynureninase